MVGFGFKSVYFTFFNSFYQTGVIKNVSPAQLLDILDYYGPNLNQQKRLMLYAFSHGEMQDFAIQHSNTPNFFYIATYFGREWIPEMSMVLPNNIVSRMIILETDETLSPEERELRIAEEQRKLFWFIYQVVIADNIILGNYTQSHAHWHVLNWFMNPATIKEIIKHDFKTYLVCLEFLIHKRFAVELDKIKVDLDSVNFANYEKNGRKGVLSKQSSKYMCYLIDQLYTLSQGDPFNSDIFFVFLGSQIVNQSKRVIVSDSFKVQTIKAFIDNYKQWGSDPRFRFSEEQLFKILLSMFQGNKELLTTDKDVKRETCQFTGSLQILQCILSSDIKSTFVQYQRLIQENVMFAEKMYE